MLQVIDNTNSASVQPSLLRRVELRIVDAIDAATPAAKEYLVVAVSIGWVGIIATLILRVF